MLKNLKQKNEKIIDDNQRGSLLAFASERDSPHSTEGGVERHRGV
jgi:hypothetical protein